MKEIIKIVIIIIAIVVILVLFMYFYIKTLTPNEFVTGAVNYFNVTVKIKNKDNLNKINQTKKVIIMANHINGLDYGVLYNIIQSNKKIYAVAKHNVFGDKTDGSIVSNILGLFKDSAYDFFNLIPYIRGNKDSGTKVKQKMLNVVNNGDIVILFPEGETSRSGIPISFKPGSFKLCADNNISILPITIKYNKQIGVNRTDPINMKKWHNAVATAIVHPMVNNTNPDILREQVFQAIRKPLILNSYFHNS